MTIRQYEITERDLNWQYATWMIGVVSFTILTYDYFLTFSAEVERFWPGWLRDLLGLSTSRHDSKSKQSRKQRDTEGCSFSWASILFFLNRYLVILGHIPMMVDYFGIHDLLNRDMATLCQEMKIYHQSIALITQIIVAVLMTMRVYALYERRIWVVVLYVAFFCILVAFALWAVLNSRFNDSPGEGISHGCATPLSHRVAIYMIIGWSGESLFDFLVFGMTLYKTLTLPGGRHRGTELLTILIRDGSLYFAVIVLVNVANILTFVINLEHVFGGGSLTMFTNAISSIMMSRLMLNLRDPKLRSHDQRCPNEDSTTSRGLPTFDSGLESGSGILMTSVEIGSEE